MKKPLLFSVFILSLIFGAASVSADTAPSVLEPMLEKVPSRPMSDLGPTPVSVFMWLIDIDSINSAQQNFTVSVYVMLQWKDPRLAHGGAHPKRYATTDIWTPRAQIINEIGIVRRTMADVADVQGDGTVTYRQRFVGPLSQPLKLHDFPFDQHLFRVHLVSMAAGNESEIQFIPHSAAVDKGLSQAAGISPEISLPDWTVDSYNTRPLAYHIADQINAPGYAFEFTAKRDWRFYVVKVILPLILIVIMSWVAFWIDPREIGVNVTAVMTSMLTLVAYRQTFENYIPKVGYLTRIDKFMLWSTLLVFFSMIQVALNSALVARDHYKLAIQIDRWARLIYPLFFIFVIAAAFTL